VKHTSSTHDLETRGRSIHIVCILLPQPTHWIVNPLAGDPLTGEPCAGEPHARFGGGRDRETNRSFLPLSLVAERRFSPLVFRRCRPAVLVQGVRVHQIAAVSWQSSSPSKPKAAPSHLTPYNGNSRRRRAGRRPWLWPAWAGLICCCAAGRFMLE